MKQAMIRADQRARIRDSYLDNHQYIDLTPLKEIEKRAEDQGYMLIKKNDKNHATFTQNISDNIQIIVKHGYLTPHELAFLTSIQPLLEYQINAIMNKDTNKFMTISEIAKYLGRDRSGVSRNVSKLLEKGILFEFVNVQEIKQFKRNVSPRTLFVNPEIFYAGDRNKIDGTLATLVAENDQLEKNGIKLKWKVWRKQGNAFGRLYNRKTYLRFKNE